MSQFPCPTCGQSSGCNHMIAPGPAQPVVLVCDLTTPPEPPVDYELVNLLCDPVSGEHVITVLAFDPANGTFVTSYYNQDGTSYTGGVPIRCQEDYEYTAPFIFCLNGTSTISRTDVYQSDTYITSIWQDALGNVIPAPSINNIISGTCEKNDYEILLLCDSGNNDKKFIRVIHFDFSATPSGVSDFELDGLTPYTTIGEACVCPEKCCRTIEG